MNTRAVFIKILKYVENSEMEVYRKNRSFKMASNSEALLACENTEGILAAIDSDILAEPNELDNEFATVVSKYSFKKLFFMPKLQKKI